MLYRKVLKYCFVIGKRRFCPCDIQGILMIDRIRKASGVKSRQNQNHFYRSGVLSGIFSQSSCLHSYGDYLDRIICFAIWLNENFKIRSVIHYSH